LQSELSAAKEEVENAISNIGRVSGHLHQKPTETVVEAAKRVVEELARLRESVRWIPVSKPPEDLNELVVVGGGHHEPSCSKYHLRLSDRTHYLRLPPLPEKQEDETIHTSLADLLGSIGWASTNDAQWKNLKKALPEIRTLLAAKQSTGGQTK
jgi:hypothetical protein